MSCPVGHSVAVIGGGLAGLAAGCALSDAGYRVTVFERKPFLGGRASSYQHPATGEVVDNCQHVLLGCCTNLLNLYRRIGAEGMVRWYTRLTFIEPGGRQSEIGESLLPAPLHSVPSFVAAKCLSWRDKLSIARALTTLLGGLPRDDGRSFHEWLIAHQQTPGGIERFWKVVLVSALNEDLTRMSVPAAAMVFRESFLRSARGGHMGVPRVPLTDLYSKAGGYIAENCGAVELRSAVEEVQPVGDTRIPESEGLWASRCGVRLCVNGKPRMFDYAVLAVPFDGLDRLLPDGTSSAPLRAQAAQFETSPITGVHLWFDRQITDLDHAVLLDRTIQWMFHKSRIQDRRAGGEPAGDYLEVVISASKSLVEMPRQEVIDLAVGELAEFFPVVKTAKLLKGAVVKEVHATYAPLPGSDAYRPYPGTPWPRVFLAGDWTASGWPATMEGAVRSGYLAAEALCASTGESVRFLAPDLPASGLVRLLGL